MPVSSHAIKQSKQERKDQVELFFNSQRPCVKKGNCRVLRLKVSGRVPEVEIRNRPYGCQKRRAVSFQLFGPQEKIGCHRGQKQHGEESRKDPSDSSDVKAGNRKSAGIEISTARS